MAITIATGTQIAIASTYGASVAMSALSNASESVATLAGGHSVVVGDFLEVTSGWDLLTGKIVRVKTVATNDITFESIDTTSTSNYPNGTGTGSMCRTCGSTSSIRISSAGCCTLPVLVACRGHAIGPVVLPRPAPVPSRGRLCRRDTGSGADQRRQPR